MKASWLKNLGAAIGGYVVMFAVAFVLFAGAWFVLGAERGFEPGQWDVSTLWIVVTSALGLVVAVAGGYTASVLSVNRVGPILLAVLIVVAGVFQAMPDDAVMVGRQVNATMFEAMANARMPLWLLILNPILGVIGVGFGAHLEEQN